MTSDPNQRATCPDAATCSSDCSLCAGKPDPLQARLSTIGRRYLVLSGKGGVGKSTVAANLATALATIGHRTGLMDVDIHGPSIPRLLGIRDSKLTQNDQDELMPVQIGPLKVMSIGFMLPSEEEALIWRGPMKYNAIKQFLSDVNWGELDFLIADAPPGTGDEPLAIAQLLGRVDGAIIVTTPQDIATTDVKKCITFCNKAQIPVTGVIENMSGLICPHCGEEIELFKKGGGERMAKEMNVPFLGSIPIDPQICTASDEGTPFVERFKSSPAAKAFYQALYPILNG